MCPEQVGRSLHPLIPYDIVILWEHREQTFLFVPHNFSLIVLLDRGKYCNECLHLRLRELDI